MDTFSTIISLWPSGESLAEDLDLPGDNPGGTVRAWKRRNRLPAEYWERMIEAAVERGIPDVTADRLARIASMRRRAA